MALDEDEVRALARRIKAEGEVEAIAINFLFSYVNPVHELRAKTLFDEECPEIPLSISYEVLAKWKEYERASTTLADACLKPVVGRGFAAMGRRFDDLGLDGRVAVMKSNGGESAIEGAMAQRV